MAFSFPSKALNDASEGLWCTLSELAVASADGSGDVCHAGTGYSG